ncbi:MAG: GNAT family N-acetyltransferase [Oscillospiraceae bacterium]|nr:GNAT family N-acetyltransferase [Oscillospiraceae bacterium]
MNVSENNLTIRNASPKDAALLGGWWRDGAIMAHAGFPNGLAVTDEEIAASLAMDSDETRRRLIIELDRIPIGEMNFDNRGDGTVNIGIKICRADLREKGLGTRFLHMLIGELFGNMGYKKIVLDTNLNNTRAQHVYEKVGFRKLGVRKNCWENQLGELQSCVDYELVRS